MKQNDSQLPFFKKCLSGKLIDFNFNYFISLSETKGILVSKADLKRESLPYMDHRASFIRAGPLLFLIIHGAQLKA